VHGTPRDPLDEFAPADAEFWQRRLEHVDADYVCVGHTHVQYQLSIGKTTVVNPGSVGLPRDGDPRAAYAIITDDGPTLKRVEYRSRKPSRRHGSDLPDHAKNLMFGRAANGQDGAKKRQRQWLEWTAPQRA